jgi:fatty-acyl-CoA synthase
MQIRLNSLKIITALSADNASPRNLSPKERAVDQLDYIDLLDRACRLGPDRPALSDDSGTISHSQLATLTHRFAHALLARGFAPSSPYAILSPNTSLAMVALLGGMRAGGAWSNINLRSGASINADLLHRGGCVALFFHSTTLEQVLEIAAHAPAIKTFVCLDREIEGYPSLEGFIKEASDQPVHIRLALDATAFQGSTGGTTGAPKITQAPSGFTSWNMIGFISVFSEFDTDSPPVNLAIAPITHAGGFIAMAALAMGGEVVLKTSAELGSILEAIAAHKISLLFLPPTLIYMLMNHPQCKSTDFSSLRYLMSAAAPLVSEKIVQAHAMFGPVICQSLGQTESGFPLTFMSKQAITQAVQNPALAKRLRSVGRPTVNVIGIEVVDESGKFLGPDEVGELVVKGPTVMLRYLNDPQASAAINMDGWQRTGDVGFRDSDGFIYLSDRKRDLIISGGFNVFPLQVEEVLNQHPAVQDCAVIGVPDDKWGEAVKAVIELAPGRSVGAQELIDLCKEKLGGVMSPKSVDFVEQLPRSAVGKVLKRSLRAPYWEGKERRI